MLKQKDIDELMNKIQNGETPILFYVCDYNETRDNNNNADFKTNHKYKVLEVKLHNIISAYDEYLKFYADYTSALEEHKEYPLDHLINFHVEEDYEYYDYLDIHRICHKYIVPNGDSSYTKDLNPRIPSKIYGECKVYKDKEYVTPSPIKAQYTNLIEYCGFTEAEAKQMFEDGKLDWKYVKLDNNAIIDGIEYKYLYTNYYILETINFPTVEYPLVNVTEKCNFFTNLEDAWEFIKECEA